MSSLGGVFMSPQGMSSVLLAPGIPHFYSWDHCSLVVRAFTRLPSGNSSPLEAEGLLSRCDVLGDTSRVVPGESLSVLTRIPSIIW